MADQEILSDDGAAGILPPGSRTETSFQKPLAFVSAGQKISVHLNGVVIADSSDVIIVHEKGHKPMLYFPRGDVVMELANPMEQTTLCPRKGDASYFEFEGAKGPAVAWSYEDPIPQATVLKDCLAFYPDNLEFNRES